jgi:hypothetical protein
MFSILCNNIGYIWSFFNFLVLKNAGGHQIPDFPHSSLAPVMLYKEKNNLAQNKMRGILSLE